MSVCMDDSVLYHLLRPADPAAAAIGTPSRARATSFDDSFINVAESTRRKSVRFADENSMHVFDRKSPPRRGSAPTHRSLPVITSPTASLGARLLGIAEKNKMDATIDIPSPSSSSSGPSSPLKSALKSLEKPPLLLKTVLPPRHTVGSTWIESASSDFSVSSSMMEKNEEDDVRVSPQVQQQQLLLSAAQVAQLLSKSNQEPRVNKKATTIQPLESRPFLEDLAILSPSAIAQAAPLPPTQLLLTPPPSLGEPTRDLRSLRVVTVSSGESTPMSPLSPLRPPSPAVNSDLWYDGSFIPAASQHTIHLSIPTATPATLLSALTPPPSRQRQQLPRSPLSASQQRPFEPHSLVDAAAAKLRSAAPRSGGNQIKQLNDKLEVLNKKLNFTAKTCSTMLKEEEDKRPASACVATLRQTVSNASHRRWASTEEPPSPSKMEHHRRSFSLGDQPSPVAGVPQLILPSRSKPQHAAAVRASFTKLHVDTNPAFLGKVAGPVQGAWCSGGRSVSPASPGPLSPSLDITGRKSHLSSVKLPSPMASPLLGRSNPLRASAPTLPTLFNAEAEREVQMGSKKHRTHTRTISAEIA